MLNTKTTIMATITLNIPEEQEDVSAIVSNSEAAMKALMGWLDKINQPKVAEHIILKTYSWVHEEMIKYFPNLMFNDIEAGEADGYQVDMLDNVSEGRVFSISILAINPEKGEEWFWVTMYYHQDGIVTVSWETPHAGQEHVFEKFTGRNDSFSLQTWQEGHAMIQQVFAKMEEIPALPEQ